MDTLLMAPKAIPGTPELPADVILTILEELHKRQGISHLRVVSKQFDALIVPLSYRHVHLTERIVAPFAFKQELYDPSVVQLQVACDVKNHARHLTVKRNLDWSLVAKLIQSLVNLRSFTWAFWDPEATNIHKSADLIIGPALCNTWPNVQLHFEGIHASTYRPLSCSHFPNSNLTSCKVATWENLQLPMIRELLFERPKVQELHLVHGKRWNWEGDRPKIDVHDDRTFKHLPALKNLILEGYNWNHPPWENCNLWNWSSITHLELRRVDVDKFLYHVPHQNLSGLRVFIEQQYSEAYIRRSEKKTRLLCSLIRHTTALEQLEIECLTQKSDIVSSIAQNGSHIRILSLLYVGRRFSPWWTPLTVDQLRTIGSSCPQLMEIDVDLALPSVPHIPSATSQSAPKMTRTAASTVVTRSMSRVENPILEADNTNRGHSRIGELREVATTKGMPSWYLEAYIRGKYQESSPICPDRMRKYRAEAEDNYLTWRLKLRKEEVAAALKKSIHDDPAPALAGFRNLRRLNIFTKVYHFVPPEDDSATFSRTREMVQHWLNRLLQMKTGASFEEVVFYINTEVMNAEINFKKSNLHPFYTFTGERNSDGNPEIREDRRVWRDMPAKARARD